ESDEASVPFGADGAGNALGEGAVALLLESEESARARGARPLARVAGAAGPGEGSEALLGACGDALARTGASPSDVSLVAAGAAGGSADGAEADALATFLHARTVPVCAPRGSVGESFGAAGLLQVAVAAWALAEGRAFPLVPDAPRRLPAPLRPAPGAEPIEGRAALATGLGLEGQSAAVAVVRA
ncbi:MAG: hypothetical protein L0216_07255, partial [Planctomycetales bacterium]|nr:hypothetical protein [Planctomycetales bacterium]